MTDSLPTTYRLSLKEGEDTWAFGIGSILKVTYTEHIGLRLPTMLVTVMAKSEVLQAIEIGQKIELSIMIRNQDLKYKMELVDLNSLQVDVPSGEDVSVHQVTLKLVHRYEELVRTLEIDAQEASIREVLESLGTKVGDGISEEGSQVWVRANKSVKHMLRKLITHLYLGKKDCPVSAITQEGVRVESLQSLVKKEPLPLANYLKEGSALVKIKGLDTSNSFQLKRGRPESINYVVDKLHNKIIVLDYNGEEIDTSQGSDYEVGRKVYGVDKIFIDGGNCYADYYKAHIRNKTAWLGLQSESVYLIVNDLFGEKIKLLDTVELKTKDATSKYEGKWIVSEVSFTLYPTVGDLKAHIKIDKIPSNYYKNQGVVS